MAYPPIQLKRSDVSGRVPAAGDLALGELAVNVADGRLFLKKANGDVADLTSIAGIIGLTEALGGKVNVGDVDFTIIYPNGGSAASPANVAINTRYVEDNPFPGYRVHCVAEIYYGGQWGESGAILNGSSSTTGVKAAQLADDKIVVQTGLGLMMVSSHYTLSPFGYTGGNSASPLPCRVKVWKVKGAIV